MAAAGLRRMLTTGLLFTAGTLLVLNGALYLWQPRMIFFPVRALQATPTDWGLRYEDVRLRSADGIELHGWFIPAAAPGPTVLFLHGNAGNISHRRESIEIFHRLGANVLIIDYRGYGASGGRPDERGLYLDAMTAWRHLVDARGIAATEIVIFGRSLGGAVAAHLAARVDAAGVILESTFSSAQDVAGHWFPVLSRLLVLRYAFPSADAVTRRRMPLLVLHSPDDEIVPFTLGRRLFDAAAEPKRFVALRGDHNGGFLSSRPVYQEALREFIDRVTGRPTRQATPGSG